MPMLKASLIVSLPKSQLIRVPTQLIFSLSMKKKISKWIKSYITYNIRISQHMMSISPVVAEIDENTQELYGTLVIGPENILRREIVELTRSVALCLDVLDEALESYNLY